MAGSVFALAAETSGSLRPNPQDLPELFMPQRINRVQARATKRRKKSEDEADDGGKTGSKGNDGKARVEGDGESVGRKRCEPKAEPYAEDAAEQRQHRRLDDKLGEDVPLLCADGEADADFAGALGDR